MGYTNYWNQYREFTDKEWSKIRKYFANNFCIEDTYYEGKEIDVYENSDHAIQFDGQGSQSCERFSLFKDFLERYYREVENNPFYIGYKGEDEFYFCKTQQFPYDEVVWKLLKFIKFEVLDPKDKSFSISNDNGEEY